MACDVKLRVIEDEPVRLLVNESVVIRSVQLPWYEGPYAVTPAVTAQTLSTTDTAMVDDVTVAAIPYTETPNAAGGLTASIA
jgi:hypothetical protein